MKLLVVGSLHLDVVLNAPYLPALDETVTGSAVAYVFGGKGGNQAVAASRMGADVCFAGRAGQDMFGDMIRETLRASRIDLSQLQTDPGPSGMSAAIVDANGDYGAVIVSAANLRIAGDEITIPDGVVLVLLQNEIPEAVNLAVARRAKAAGAAVWLNAAPVRALPKALMDVVDLLVVNGIEADYYADMTGGPEKLTTLGAEGVRYQDRLHRSFPVDPLSTHGAGDMFVGALAARVVAGQSIVEALPFAQAAAALHVSTDPASRGAITPGQVTDFLDANSRRQT